MRSFGPPARAGPMKIAIVGSGISGLVCAHLLRRRHEITLFEADSRLGGHTNTIRVDLPDETHHVDIVFTVYNDRNYPGFERLLDQLGVGDPAVRDELLGIGRRRLRIQRLVAKRPIRVSLASGRALVSPDGPRSAALQPRGPRPSWAWTGSGPSLGEFLHEGGYSREFMERLIVPQASAVWSADPAQMWDFPGELAGRGLRQPRDVRLERGRPRWRPVVGSSKSYVDALTATLGRRIRLSTPVRRDRAAGPTALR